MPLRIAIRPKLSISVATIGRGSGSSTLLRDKPPAKSSYWYVTDAGDYRLIKHASAQRDIT
jgi:hypothetical protein